MYYWTFVLLSFILCCSFICIDINTHTKRLESILKFFFFFLGEKMRVTLD